MSKAKSMGKALAASMRQTKEAIAANAYTSASYGLNYDISEPSHATNNPELAAADTESLINLWRVRYGGCVVGSEEIGRGDAQWQTIAHVLWKRKELEELKYDPPLYGFSTPYRLKDGNS